MGTGVSNSLNELINRCGAGDSLRAGFGGHRSTRLADKEYQLLYTIVAYRNVSGDWDWSVGEHRQP